MKATYSTNVVFVMVMEIYMIVVVPTYPRTSATVRATCLMLVEFAVVRGQSMIVDALQFRETSVTAIAMYWTRVVYAVELGPYTHVAVMT